MMLSGHGGRRPRLRLQLLALSDPPPTQAPGPRMWAGAGLGVERSTRRIGGGGQSDVLTQGLALRRA